MPFFKQKQTPCPAKTSSHGNNKLFLLSLGALGIVYGDIGTSPLYTVNEIFFGHKQISVTPENVYGGISLIIWALTLVVVLKYLIFVLRADHDGEGGVFALYSLLKQFKKKSFHIIMILLTIAAGLLFGDGFITPAISVLSAVEGLKVATPALGNATVIITILILTGLFAIQQKGTEKVGSFFGPIIGLWFIVLSILGGYQLIQHPSILHAFNPLYGLSFLKHSGFHASLLILGSVMLSITGGEALFADLGHFGKKPIRLSWFFLVYPALLLIYLGQGAFLLGKEVVQSNNVFYSMVPTWGLYPMVILATIATIIASQALISGAFSLATQAISLGLFPRLRIKHTHPDHAGQIYVGAINWTLYAGCVLLVIIFGSSSRLASVYGLAVSGDMLVTSLAMILIARLCWKWQLWKALLLFGGFAFIDLSFLTANSLKFLEGGFVPLSIGIIIFVIMSTWRWGRKKIFKGYTDLKSIKVKELIALKEKMPELMNRSVILITPKAILSPEDNTPALLQLFLDRYGIVPKHLIFLDVLFKRVPYVHNDRYRVTVFQKENGKGSIIGVTVQFGFMEEANVENILEELAQHNQINLEKNPAKWLIHASMENLLPGKNIAWHNRLRLKLFSLLRQNSQPAYYYFGLGNKENLSLEIFPMTIE